MDQQKQTRQSIEDTGAKVKPEEYTGKANAEVPYQLVHAGHHTQSAQNHAHRYGGDFRPHQHYDTQNQHAGADNNRANLKPFPKSFHKAHSLFL